MSTNDKYLFSYLTPTGWKKESPNTFKITRKLILDEAEELGIAWDEIKGAKIYRLQYKGHIEFFKGETPGSTTYIGYLACIDKIKTKHFLHLSNISTPKGYLVQKYFSHSDLEDIFHSLKKPLVIKPLMGKQGTDIIVNNLSLKSFLTNIEKLLKIEKYAETGILVEEQFSGKEYRILATREKVVGVIYRLAANVIGDGINTIEMLIDIKNKDPRRGPDHNLWPLVSLQKGKLEEKVLQEQGFTLSSIPDKGCQVFLRKTSNISTGGDSYDMTDQIHPSVAAIAIKAIKAIPGLTLGGVDFMTKNITLDQTNDMYSIIEINHSPGIDIHHFPAFGEPRNAAKEFLLTMFPDLV